jgi:hypothetical protein
MSDKYLCNVCEKKFTYITSLKNHLQNLHRDLIGTDENSKSKWEDHCKLFKEATKSVTLLKDLPEKPKPRIRTSRLKKKQKQADGLQEEKAVIEEDKYEEDFIKLPISPKVPLDNCDHNHVHSEFCGDPMVIHGNHIDYIHNAELHYVAQSRAVYPHKLEISSANPSGCKPKLQYPWLTDYYEVEGECKEKFAKCLKVLIFFSR